MIAAAWVSSSLFLSILTLDRTDCLRLPFPGHGLQRSWYQGVWTFPQSLFRSLDFVQLTLLWC